MLLLLLLLLLLLPCPPRMRLAPAWLLRRVAAGSSRARVCRMSHMTHTTSPAPPAPVSAVLRLLLLYGMLCHLRCGGALQQAKGCALNVGLLLVGLPASIHSGVLQWPWRICSGCIVQHCSNLQ
jgi:hypothetical protein